MRTVQTALPALLLCATLGCAAQKDYAPPGMQSSGGAPAAPVMGGEGSRDGAARGEAEQAAAYQDVSLSRTAAAQEATEAVGRKIIRNASLSVEVESPSQALQRVASVAESLGGYVVTSESRQQGGTGDSRPYEVVTVQMRVPAGRFDEALRQVRAAGSRVTGEKISGQDVTEEFIDLDARLRTQRALEAQFLEIMRGARDVSAALQVQRELANVRTEIERVEGRRRFLESQVNLSTINVTLSPAAPLVSASGFFHGLRDAFGDGIDAAATITLWLIRVALALLPVLLLFVLPAVLLARRVRRRLRRARVAD